MNLGFDAGSQQLLNGVVLAIAVGVGLFIGGLFGVAIGGGAGFAFVEITTEITRLNTAVETLEVENEQLRQRIAELEAE